MAPGKDRKRGSGVCELESEVLNLESKLGGEGRKQSGGA